MSVHTAGLTFAAVLAKRREFVAKDDATTFAEAFGQTRVSQDLWQYTDALVSAIRNAMQADGVDRAALISTSIDQFAAALKEALPTWLGEAGSADADADAESDSETPAEKSASAQVAQLAAEIRKANPKLTALQAEASVYKAHPELIRAVELEDFPRRRR